MRTELSGTPPLSPKLKGNITPRKKVLMIAYFFPPVGGIGAAGAQRVLKFAKYLPASQWQPVILTGKESAYESYLFLDHSLVEKVPPDTKIIRTTVIRWLATLLKLKNALRAPARAHEAGAKTATTVSPLGKDEGKSVERGRYQRLKDAFTDLFEIPDEEMGWFLPGVFAGLRAIRRESIDAIFSTGRPWTAHLIGVALKLLTGRPLVVDFRDPWLTNPFRIQYSALKNRLEAALEKQVITHADVVIANTCELREEFIRRFPQQPHSKFMTLLNGFDPDDYVFEGPENADGTNHCFTITHTGFLYGKRDPKMFLEAVKWLLDNQYLNRQDLKIYLVGAIELPYDFPAYLEASGLRDIVVLQEHLPYRQSLEYLWKSDVLLLLQPGTKTQIPSKLFEYIGMRKPIIAVSPRDGATCQLMVNEGLGTVADPENIEEIGQAIRSLYQAWVAGALSATISDETYRKFNAKSITATLATTFTDCIAIART